MSTTGKLEVSAEWTEKERLEVIKAKAVETMKIFDPKRPASLADMFGLLDEIYRLSFMPAEFLETNRKRLLDEQ